MEITVDLDNRNKTVKISGCWHQCPYFHNSMDGMECRHPYFDNFPGYENMIISWTENIKTGFPSKCPLLKESK